MFSEILKIIPKLDGKDLSSMENSLNGRFKRIAKKFGSGLVEALKGGGIIALAGGLIDKFLNPLKEVQAAIDRSLKQGDDLSTYAKQFNTTSGNLARLQAFGKSTGLDDQGVRMLLEKFQSAVAQAAADPETVTSVSKYVGKKDTAEAFFEFVQAMQKLTPIQQSLVQQQVFGERQILAASSFLHGDFSFLGKHLGGPSSEVLTSSAERLGTLKSMQNLLEAKSELNDLPKKAKLIGPHTIAEIQRAAELDLRQENKGIGKFDSLSAISLENQKLMNAAVNKFLLLAPIAAQVMTRADAWLSGGQDALNAISRSRAARAIKPGKDN